MDRATKYKPEMVDRKTIHFLLCILILFNHVFCSIQTSVNTNTFREHSEKEAESISLTKDQMILRSLDSLYRSRLLPTNVNYFDDSNDRIKSSNPRLISAKKCKRELTYLINKYYLFKQNNSSTPIIPIDLAALFDSYANEEPGLLAHGHHHWTGNWRQCSRVEIFDLNREDRQSSMLFGNRYCIASLKNPSWNKELDDRVRILYKDVPRNNAEEYNRKVNNYKRFFKIQVGLCLPDSCDSNSITNDTEIHSFISTLVRYKLNDFYKKFEFIDLFCLPDSKSELTTNYGLSGYLFIGFSLCWLSSVIMATILDCRSVDENQDDDGQQNKLKIIGSSRTVFINKLVISLSLRRNFKRLLEFDHSKQNSKQSTFGHMEPQQQQQQQLDNGMKQSKGKQTNEVNKDDLLFLNALKTIGMPIILLNHTKMILLSMGKHSIGSEPFKLYENTLFFVDWYFVIIGFMTTYSMFAARIIEKCSIKHWIYLYLNRYWRIIPVYLIVFWFSKTMFVFTGSGPYWDYGTNNMTLRSICRQESFFWPLTLTANLHPINEECLLPAWYFATNMQFFIVSPIFLLILHKLPIIGWLTSLSLIFVTSNLKAINYITEYKSNELLDLITGRSSNSKLDLHSVYLLPQFRLPAYLIGLLAGHYAYMVLSGKWRSFLYDSSTKSHHLSLNSLARLGIWIFGLANISSIVLLTLASPLNLPELFQPLAKYLQATVHDISHTYSALALALVLCTTMFGQFPFLRKLMSRPIWTILSRLNFCIFLIHIEILYYQTQTAERMLELTKYETFMSGSQLIFSSYWLAAFLVLCLELPTKHLEREFAGCYMNISKQGQFVDNSSFDIQEQNGKQQQQQCELTIMETTRSDLTTESSNLVASDTLIGNQRQDKADEKPVDVNIE